MNKCSERIYKFKKGKELSVDSDEHGSTWKSFELLITYTDGTIIGTVHSNYINYNVTTYRGAVVSEHLSGGGNTPYLYGNVHDLSVTLSKDGQFVITGSSPNAFTPPVIGRDNMTLTEYGEEMFRECFVSTLEYHAPADNSTDHSDDQATYNEQYSKSYSALNPELL